MEESQARDTTDRPAPSATASTTVEVEPDFGEPRPDPKPRESLMSSRVVVLYDAASLFECAIAATLKCEKAIASISAPTTDYAVVAREIMSFKPHAVIILNNKWSRDLFANLAKPTPKPDEPAQGVPEFHSAERSPEGTPDGRSALIIVLCAAPASEGTASEPTEASDTIMYVDPLIFTKIAPCRSEISAFNIFSHLLRGEFPQYFRDADTAATLEEARFFRLALRASTTSTLGAWSFVNDIVSNWKRVMEPDSLVLYGRFIANVGPVIARKRIDAHSVIIKLDPWLVCVVECPDFEEVVGNVALTSESAVIVYSLSADTFLCKLICRTTKECSARAILAQIAPRAELSPACQDNTAETTVATNDFFAIIRKAIYVRSEHVRDDLSPEVKAVIEEGERALKEACAAPSGTQP